MKYSRNVSSACVLHLPLCDRTRRDWTTGGQVNREPLGSGKTVDSSGPRAFNRGLALNAGDVLTGRSAPLKGNVQEEVFTVYQLEVCLVPLSCSRGIAITCV